MTSDPRKSDSTKPIPRAEPDEETRRYADGLAGLLEAAGFPRMPARVLMALLTSPHDGLTAEQLSDVLDASRAAISGAVRYLESVRVLRADSLPKTRKRVYRVVSGWYTATLSRRSLYRELAERAAQRPPALAEGTAAGERVREMADFYAFLDRRFPELLEEWESRR
jgi:hypothetical protein